MATLSDIRDRVRQRADIENETARYPDSEVNQYINDSYKELFTLLQRYGLVRTEKTQTITADGSTSYAVSSDYFATLKVFYQDGTTLVSLRRHEFKNRPFDFSGTTGQASSYRVAHNGTSLNIELVPKPGSGTYLHTYIPVPADLSDDSDTIDSVMGWDEFIVIDAAIKALVKEDSDTSQLMIERERIMARIEAESAMREMAETHSITDTRRRAYDTNDPADTWHGGRDYPWGDRW